MRLRTTVQVHVTDDDIIIFKFERMGSFAANTFAKIIRANAANPPDKLRVLYDMSESPPPTPYFIHVQGELYDEFPHPQDERAVYLINPDDNDLWVKALQEQFHPTGTMRIFRDRQKALVWLRET